MNKYAYLQMLVEEIEDNEMRPVYEDVADAVEIALSQMPDDFEVQNTKLGVDDFYKTLQAEAEKLRKKSSNRNIPTCIGPFTAAEMFAPMIGATYHRASDRFKKKPATEQKTIIKLEDLL